MKDSGIKWIGKIPDGWSTIRIKFTSWLKGRIGWDGLKSSEFVEKGPYLITGTDFENGGINWNTCVHISEARYQEDELLHIKENDLLITKDGTIGKLAIVKNCPEKVSLNSGVMIIRGNSQYKYSDKYLYYVLQSDEFFIWFELSQNGNSTIRHLYQGQFYNFEFSYPTIDEQQAIAAFLDKKCFVIDNLISNETKQIEKLKEYRQAIITKAVTKGLDPNAPMKDSGVEWIGRVPLNWMTPKFKNLATLSNGREIEEDGGDIPVYGSGGIFKYTKRPLFEGISLLTGRKGTIDNPMLVNGAFWTVDTMFYTSSINLKRVLPEYLFYAFKGCCNFGFYKSGSVLPSMTQSQINNITIPLPTLEEQRQILAILQVKMGKIDSLLSLLNRNIEKLNSYKKSLIYEYVTGKRRVCL